MSLLMDALKKAEQAKAGTDDSSGPVAPAEVAPRSGTERIPLPTRPEDEADGLELTLEEPVAAVRQDCAAAAAPALDEAVRQAESQEPLQTRPERDMPRSADAGAPVVEPQQMTLEPAPEPPATGRAEGGETLSAGSPHGPAGGERVTAEEKPAAVRRAMPAPDPQQLQRTFVLKSRVAAGRKRLLLFTLGGVALLSLLGGGYYYLDHALSSLGSSSLVVADGFADQGAEDIPDPAEMVADGEESPDSPLQGAQEGSGAPFMQAVTPVQQGTSGMQTVPMQQAAQAPLAGQSVPEDRTAAAMQESMVADVQEPAADRPPQQARIRIVRKQTSDPFNRRLLEAYQAYQAGHYPQAAGLYQEVLKQDATNRDALLGLAAIAHRGGERERAADYYITLLKYDPRDSSAISGLVSLQGGSLTVENETRIKMLLDQEPEAAHLHFTLGTLYAGQSRWADAQQSFFNAHRYAPENADYAYNLAVSLDRIGKQAAALEYYRRAVALAGEQRAMFNLSEANGRIHALTALADLTRQAR